jgi:hypothetical protein
MIASTPINIPQISFIESVGYRTSLDICIDKKNDAELAEVIRNTA